MGHRLRLRNELMTLYRNGGCCFKHSTVTLSGSYGQWMAGTEAIYNEIKVGKLNPADLTEALFDQKIKEYSKGVGKGLGKDWLEIDFSRPNYSRSWAGTAGPTSSRGTSRWR